ncbi:MAG: exo-alpha-sialidase [Gammaproteobacteria bacterium]|nr:exo-alpha-sialidase [Gammaproteobacteria bacterium]
MRSLLLIYLMVWFSLTSNASWSEEIAAPPILHMQPGLLPPDNDLLTTLPQTERATHYRVFKAIENDAQYNHGAVLFHFNGQLFCQWQTSKRDEDGPDTHVLYSVSDDGRQWQPPRTLAAIRDDAIVTSGGWWSDGNQLVAFVNVWPKQLSPKAGHTEYAISRDGLNWSPFKPVTNATGKPLRGIIEQDLKALPSGRVLTAFHRQPGLIATPYYTDDPLTISGWTAGNFNNLPHKGSISRELEPSWFRKPGGEIVMTFRDQAGSFKILAAQSDDNGASWTSAEITNVPDSRAKQSAGNLPDGTAFIVNNPTGNKTRLPLVILLSRDGEEFNRAMVLRGQDQLPAMRFAGKYKRVGYSYPKSYVWNNALWVSYAVNKEDIAVTRLALQPTP